MHLNCIGTWKGKGPEQYMAVEDQETGEIRCAMLKRLSPEKLVLYMSGDAQCSGLSSNNSFPMDTYRLRQKKLRKNLAICQFPEWLQGQYNEVTIIGDTLTYNPNALQSSSAISYCIDADEDRIAVFSETLCEEVIGFHCFRFRTRSNSVIEFKTTDRYDSYKPDLCKDDTLFENSFWTAMVAAAPETVSCGYTGIFETALKEQDSECYRMTVDCKYDHIMRISAYNCVSGTIHDTRSYECLAVWKETNDLFVYSQQIPDRQNNCFITRMVNGQLLISSSGIHCQRNYNFTLNSEKTLVLQQKAKCAESDGEMITSNVSQMATHNVRVNREEIITVNASSSNRRKSPASRTVALQQNFNTNSISSRIYFSLTLPVLFIILLTLVINYD
uniref:Uncharacterized protein n=1 Tax=Syphacia muris TaxID=451379 RepID=A0A0N5AIM2_9BILA